MPVIKFNFISLEQASTLKAVSETGKAPAEGLWLGGYKYRVVKADMENEVGDYKIPTISCARSKAGVHICVTAANIVAGFYDEEKGQVPGNALKTTVAFAEYLMSIGY